IADAPQGRGGAWSSKGVIVFSPSLSGPLWSVSETGGPATQLTKLDAAAAETTHRWPSFLPDGEHFIYLANGNPKVGHRILLASIDRDIHRELLRARSNAIYSPTGHLVYIRERSLVAQPFNAKTFALDRNIVPLVEDVASGGRLDGCFTLSSHGLLAYQT